MSKDIQDVIIIGAGAAGMMCARQAAMLGKNATVIEHTNKVGEKIRISGGGRCNFTNLYARPETFISQNPHFCKSALARYTPQDFIELVNDHKINWHEKPYDEGAHKSAQGQLFCDEKSTQIIDMLFNDANQFGCIFSLETTVTSIQKNETFFEIQTNKGTLKSKNLVIASGGLSIPKIGASPFAYKIAEQFGVNIIPPRAALVPLTFETSLLEKTKSLSGISFTASVKSEDNHSFEEGLLFTHRGLSGPSILQISSYWNENETISVNLKPGMDVFEYLQKARSNTPKQKIQTVLSHILPNRLAEHISDEAELHQNIADMSDKKLKEISTNINEWVIKPQGSEGYRTAEVTRGGIDTNELSSKSMETKKVEGLHFIGEAVDVTGHLGGHNFQWAWASAIACAHSL